MARPSWLLPPPESLAPASAPPLRSPAAKDFVGRLLEKDPTKRMGLEEAMQVPEGLSVLCSGLLRGEVEALALAQGHGSFLCDPRATKRARALYSLRCHKVK